MLGKTVSVELTLAHLVFQQGSQEIVSGIGALSPFDLFVYLCQERICLNDPFVNPYRIFLPLCTSSCCCCAFLPVFDEYCQTHLKMDSTLSFGLSYVKVHRALIEGCPVARLVWLLRGTFS